jgi:hypothetical protein
MNNPTIFTRFELLFWNFAIQSLSQSRTAQKMLRRAFRLLHDSEAASIGVLLGISGVVGLVSGYLFFFVAASIR